MSLALLEPTIVSQRMTANAPSVMVECAVGTEIEQVFWLATGVVTIDFTPSRSEDDFIGCLEDGYTVLRPIPVTMRPIDDDSFEASFEAANIAIAGDSAQDAYQSLIAEILDTFDTLEAEPNLSPAAAAQLATLRSFIGKP